MAEALMKNDIGKAMCEALGLEPNSVTRIAILMEPGDYVTIRVEGFDRGEDGKLYVVDDGKMQDLARVVHTWIQTVGDPVVERNHA